MLIYPTCKFRARACKQTKLIHETSERSCTKVTVWSNAANHVVSKKAHIKYTQQRAQLKDLSKECALCRDDEDVELSPWASMNFELSATLYFVAQPVSSTHDVLYCRGRKRCDIRMFEHAHL